MGQARPTLLLPTTQMTFSSSSFVAVTLSTSICSGLQAVGQGDTSQPGQRLLKNFLLEAAREGLIR